MKHLKLAAIIIISISMLILATGITFSVLIAAKNIDFSVDIRLLIIIYIVGLVLLTLSILFFKETIKNKK